MRPKYLRVACDILAKWHESEDVKLASTQLGSMYLSRSTALLHYVKESGYIPDRSDLIAEALGCAEHARRQFEVCTVNMRTA
mmetsp:Transcript_10871/g.24684  ORF Transcript_10871/g.24684 Transcript_10871/m.24684 type:complete len:82 (+) Transcript_10871:597-842(+)